MQRGWLAGFLRVFRGSNELAGACRVYSNTNINNHVNQPPIVPRVFDDNGTRFSGVGVSLLSRGTGYLDACLQLKVAFYTNRWWLASIADTLFIYFLSGNDSEICIEVEEKHWNWTEFFVVVWCILWMVQVRIFWDLICAKYAKDSSAKSNFETIEYIF